MKLALLLLAVVLTQVTRPSDREISPFDAQEDQPEHWSEYYEREECPDGREWTTWCGCEPPIYGDDC